MYTVFWFLFFLTICSAICLCETFCQAMWWTFSFIFICSQTSDWLVCVFKVLISLPVYWSLWFAIYFCLQLFCVQYYNWSFCFGSVNILINLSAGSTWLQVHLYKAFWLVYTCSKNITYWSALYVKMQSIGMFLLILIM